MSLRAFFAIAVGGAPWFAGALAYWVGNDAATIMRVSATICLAIWTPAMVLISLLWPKESA